MKSLAYEMKKEALCGLENNRTVKTYKESIERFAVWVKATYGCRNLQELRSHKGLADELSKTGGTGKDGKPTPVAALVIQKYSDSLQANRPDGKKLSPSTIHTYLAGVCRGLGVPMDAIDKPARTAESVVKGRHPTVLGRGEIEQEAERYRRVVAFAEATGLRRSEIGRVRAENLIADVCGYPCVEVRGKGGKIQRQRLLPGGEAVIRQLIGNRTGGQRLFSREEMRNCIDFHSIRREHAQKAYAYYLGEIHAGRTEQLRAALLKTWEAYHPKNARNARNQYREYVKEVYSDRPYFLRGGNAKRARESGLPVRYNRLALMCTSVWHLAHWRADVTVRHYMM